MKKYTANLILNNELTPIEFETDINAIEYLWQRYGMDTYIESLIEIIEEPVVETEEVE